MLTWFSSYPRVAWEQLDLRSTEESWESPKSLNCLRVFPGTAMVIEAGNVKGWGEGTVWRNHDVLALDCLGNRQHLWTNRNSIIIEDYASGFLYFCYAKKEQTKLLYFVWSPPWHLYIFLLANLLAFYLTYLLAFYLAYLLAFYLAYLLAFYLSYFLAYVLAYLLASYLANLLAFYLANILALYLEYLLAFYLTVYLAYLLAFYLAYFLAYVLAYLLTFYLAFYLAVEVRQCPLGSGARGWGPAMPTGIWSSRLRSGSAHCDLEVAVEVRECPLRSPTCGWGPVGAGARSGGPAVPTGIWTARRGRWVRRRRRRRRRRAVLKSSNPHLAGGEQTFHILLIFGLSLILPYFTQNTKPSIHFHPI